MAQLDLSRRDLAALALGALVPGIPSPASAATYTALTLDSYKRDYFANHYWGVQRAPKTYAIQQAVSTSLPRHRFEVRYGDSWNSETVRNRAEFCCCDRVPFGQRIWFSYDFYVHSGTASRWNLLGQFHHTPDADDGSGVSPPFCVELKPGETLRFIRRYNSNSIGAASNTSTVVMHQRPLTRCVWHRVVGSIVFDWKGAGAVELWYDGVKIVSQAGVPIGFNDAQGPYFKFGIYRANVPETLVVEYANVELGYSSLLSRVTSPLPI